MSETVSSTTPSVVCSAHNAAVFAVKLNYGAVVQVVVELLGVEPVRLALRGGHLGRADLLGILRQLVHVDDVGQ